MCPRHGRAQVGYGTAVEYNSGPCNEYKGSAHDTRSLRPLGRWSRPRANAPSQQASLRRTRAHFLWRLDIKMTNRLTYALLGTAALAVAGCGGGSSGDSATKTGIDGFGSTMDIFEVSNGFGRLLPHQVAEPDEDGNPTGQIRSIRSLSDLLETVSVSNPILPTTQWPNATILPSGRPGNHFIYVRFSQGIEIDSVIDRTPGGQINSGLAGPITVVGVNPVTSSVTPIVGRVFVNGRTPAGDATGDPALLPLQQWVTLAGGRPEANPAIDNDGDGTPDGLGFPGTEDDVTFQGAQDLISPNTLVFVPDEDGDLATYETFPPGLQIRMRITTGVVAKNDKSLIRSGVASSTVGDDGISPEVTVSPPPFTFPVITPGNGDQNVDPLTDVVVEFTEPVQITSIGSLPDGTPPTIGAAVQLQFGPSASTVTVPFTAQPDSVYDLTRIRLRPAFNFPGSGPTFATCGVFSDVSITINSAQVRDLAGNLNSLGQTTGFSTGEGPGLVNSVVAPDAVYVARIGSTPSISVIDMNGYGQGTGNPTFDPNVVLENGTKFPYNPNVVFQSTSLIPPLQIGNCTLNGGSRGIFTLQTDSSLNDELARSPIIESVSDMMLGQALDSSFNNGPPPLGCQSGGGNLCAQSGLKQLVAVLGGANTLAPAQAGQFGPSNSGNPNIISWAPHPNPPPLIFPPLCISPFIGGQEPTSITSPATNLLVPAAFPLGSPPNIPPQGLIMRETNSFFLGPSAPQQTITACTPFAIRQQIGHFLYVADRVRREVVVLNSNRFTVVDRIPVPDPTSFAMGPNLDYLAVTNQSAGTVSMIDIDPVSSTFHSVVQTIKVGDGPTGIAWEPTNEDVIVCNELDNTISIISAFTLQVRKTVGNQLTQPFDVAILPRQVGFSLNRQVYFAHILGRNGRISIFESGPDGVNGWGNDDIVQQPAFFFENPKAIKPDYVNLVGGVWVVHEKKLDITTGQQTGLQGGALTNMTIESGVAGAIPLELPFFVDPNIRDIEYEVRASIGSDQLTGRPVDIAFDDQNNLGGVGNFSTTFSAGSPAATNGKTTVRFIPNTFFNTTEPRFMFAAIPNSTQGGGVIDVFEMDSGFQRFDTNSFQTGIQSIPANGVNVLMHYYRQ